MPATSKTRTQFMSRTPVKSSNIKSIGYDTATETLEVEFSGERVYQYFGVPAELHSDLMTAKSHGGFLYAEISRRESPYRYKRLGN
jgi:hypothetical protein